MMSYSIAKIAIPAASVLILTSISMGHSNYKGFSGAPGSLGTCAVTCHPIHYFDPDISVEGFPEYYQPGAQYTISVTNRTGNHIHQFNASVRIGESPENAGAILSGEGTAIYDTIGETNGVHWEWPNTDSGSFVWVAPGQGTGEVRLYWAGLQGYRTYGADTSFVLVSEEATTGIDDNPLEPVGLALRQNYPNPFNGDTRIEFVSSGKEKVNISIFDISGRKVYSRDIYSVGAGTQFVIWAGESEDSEPLSSGVYFYRLQYAEKSVTKKMIFLR